jgi:hypothetical protein
MDDFNWPILFSSFLVSKNYATSSGISCKLRDIYFVHICRYITIMTWYTVTEYQCHRRPRIFSHFPSAQFRRSFHDLSTRVTRMVSLLEHPTSLMMIIDIRKDTSTSVQIINQKMKPFADRELYFCILY